MTHVVYLSDFRNFALILWNMHMNEKKTAIVLYLTRHTDKTSIVHLYTRDLGRISCLANGIFGLKSKINRSLLYPLSLLDAVIVEKGEMYRLKEIEPLLSSDSFFEDPVKRCMAMFLAEVMSRSLRDADPDENLFDFVVSAINALSTRPLSPDFHLYFLLRLSAYLGFEPNMDGQGEAFDLENGVRCHPDSANMHVLDEQYSLLLIRLCQMDGTLTLTHAERQHLLDIILLYYKLHLPAFGNVRSLDVLRELFA